MIELPRPSFEGGLSVEAALKSRRSEREFRRRPLTLGQVSQLLWAAQGSTGRGHRTAPSAGALYPLEVRVVVGNVEGLADGVYRYDMRRHRLQLVVEGDMRRALASAAIDQKWVRQGAIALVFSAIYERTTVKYGKRGIRYVHMEAGHASQNVYLQAEALGLGTVVVGAFREDELRAALQLPEDEHPLSIMPVGHVRR